MPPFRRSPSYESKKGNEKNFDFKELQGARWNPCGVLTSTFLFYFRALFGRRRKGRTARRLTILSLWHPRYATKKKKKKERPVRATLSRLADVWLFVNCESEFVNSSDNLT